MNADLKQGFYLGEWQVQPLHGQVIDPAGNGVHVEPKVMDVLVFLAGRPGEVVERIELLEGVWDGRAMSDEPLNRCIAQLRRVFDDSRQDPQFVQTVPKRGYRLIAPVRLIEAAEPGSDGPEIEAGSPLPEPQKRLFDNWFAGGSLAVPAIITIVLVAFGIGRIYLSSESEPIENSIVVLPLENRGAGDDAFSHGLSQRIRTLLAQVDGLHVIGRILSDNARTPNEDLTSIAERLRVEYILDGSIVRDGDLIRTVVEVTGRDGIQIWSDTYDETLEVGSLLTRLDEIANNIVKEIAPEILQSQADMPLIRTDEPTVSTDAFIYVTTGEGLLMQRGRQKLEESTDWFEKALAVDPDYADAYVGLATAQALLPLYNRTELTVEEGFDRARAIIDEGRNRNLDDVERQSLGIRAFMSFYGDWNWIEAQQLFDEAFRTRLRDWDPELLTWYSLFLGGTGQTAESLAFASRAQEMDPESKVVRQRLAVANLWAGNNEQAYSDFEFYEGMDIVGAAQKEAYLILLLRLGKFDEARNYLKLSQRVFRGGTDWVEPVFQVLLNPEDLDRVPVAVDAVLRAEEEGAIPQLVLFGTWVYLGQYERALDAALLLIQDRPNFNTEFLFAEETAGFRRYPRFGELIRAIELDQYWDEYDAWPADTCWRIGDRIECQ